MTSAQRFSQSASPPARVEVATLRVAQSPRASGVVSGHNPAERILLMQAGWVAIGLIVVSTFPSWKTAPTTKPAPPVEASRSIPVTAPPISTEGLQASSVGLPLPRLFANGSDSLVARTVGHAEGTRAPNGSRTPAFFGHTDPGNGVWNLGSFSFQHCQEPRYNCTTPEQADVHQLQRLQTQAEWLRQRAAGLRLALTLEEELNGIDLANQAPLAALSKPGYPEYLRQAKERGLKGQDAILEARVWSYWSPQKQDWDAPGLGNTEASIRRDQQRRMLAIARVLSVVLDPAVLARSHNWLQPGMAAPANPYSYETQQAQYLWWDAGYWDAQMNRGRQVPEGVEPAYDQGFQGRS